MASRLTRRSKTGPSVMTTLSLITKRQNTIWGVSGEPGPYGPRRQKPYPMPPLPANREAEVLFPAARQLGWKPFPPPLAILSQPYRGRPACICCPCCLSYGCEANAKSDTAVTVIPEALRTGLCTLRAETLVRETTVDARGRPNGVICRWARIQGRKYPPERSLSRARQQRLRAYCSIHVSSGFRRV